MTIGAGTVWLHRYRLLVVSALAPVMVVAGCGGARGSGHATSARGTVDVLYAGSLISVMEHDLGPRFTSSTGYHFSGLAAGSSELANQVKGKVRRGDVFVSASPSVDASLMGPPNGNWVAWYATFAKAPLVIAYNPGSRFAAQLRSRPWYQVVTEPGFRLGRTDPALDPKGKLAVQALTAASRLGSSSLPGLLASSEVFPEEALVGRLESGQLDAGFFYSNEARRQQVPTVPTNPVELSATFTVTILRQAPDQAGATAFVRYLLGPSGRSVLAASGLDVASPPVLVGSMAEVPPALRPSLARP